MASQVESLAVSYDDQVSAGAKAAADALARLGDAAVLTEERVTRSSKSGATLSRQYDESARLAAKLAEVTKKYARELDDLEASELSAAEKAKLYTNIVAARDAAIQKTTAAHERWVAGLKASEAATTAQSAGMAAATASAKSWGSALGLTGQQMSALMPQLNDLVTQVASGTSIFQALGQQGGQIVQAIGGVNHSFGALVPVLVKVGVPLAVIGAGLAALSHHTGSVREVEQAAKVMGGSLGLTAEQADQLAQSAGNAGNVSVAAARSMIAEYNRVGKIGPDVIQRLIGLTRDYATLTGQDASEATKELGKLMRDPAKGAAELADKFNLLSGRELDHIQRLAEMGDRTGAQTALTEALAGRVKDAAENVDYWTRKWNALKNAGSDALDAVGRKLDEIEKGPTRSQRIANLQDQLDALRAAAEEAAALGPVDKSWKPGQSIGEATAPATIANDNQTELAGLLYEEVANSAAEAWKALGEGIAAANREASVAAETVVRGYNPIDEQIRKVTEDIAKLNKGLGPDMSDAARQAGEALKKVLEERKAALESAAGQGISLDTLKTQQMLEFQRQAVGMNPLQRERFLAERSAQVGNIGSSDQDPEQQARVNNALNQVLIQQQTAAADAARELGLQADAAERLAEAAGKGEAAQRRANIETAVAAAEVKGLGLETRVAMEAIEAATQIQIRADATKTLQDQIRLQSDLTAAYAKGPAAVQAVQLAEQARTMALKEAVEGTKEFSDAYSYYLGLLEKGAVAERGAKIADLSKQNADAIKLAQTELTLTGKSAEERARILGHLKAEMDLRRQFPGIAGDELQKLVEQSDQLLVINQQVQRQQQAWEEVTGILEKAFDRLGDALVQVFVEGKSKAVDWGNVTKGIIASLMTDLIKMAAIRPLQNAVFGTNQPTLWDTMSGSGGQNSASGYGGQLVNWGLQKAAGYAWDQMGGPSITDSISSYFGLGSAATSAPLAGSLTGSGAVGLGSATGGAAFEAGVAPVAGGLVNAPAAGGTYTAGLGAVQGAGAGATGSASSAGAGAGLGAAGSAASAALAAAVASYYVGGYIGTKTNSYAAGVAAGAGTGAAIGTMVMPVIGTAIGAIIGAIAGRLGTVKKSTMWAGAAGEYDSLGNVLRADSGAKKSEQLGPIQNARDSIKDLIFAVGKSDGMKLNGNLWLGVESSTDGAALHLGDWDKGPVVSRSEDPRRMAVDALNYLLDNKKAGNGVPTLEGNSVLVKAIRGMKDRPTEEFEKDFQLAGAIADANAGFKELDQTLAGVTNRSKEAAKEQWKGIKDEVSRADAMKIGVEYRDMLTNQLRAGWGSLKDALTPAERALGDIEGQFQTLTDNVHSLGLSITDAEIATAKGDEMAKVLNGLAANGQLAFSELEKLKNEFPALSNVINEVTKNLNDKLAYVKLGGTVAVETAINPNYKLNASNTLTLAGLDPSKFPSFTANLQNFLGGASASAQGLRDMAERTYKHYAAGRITAEQYNSIIGSLTESYKRATQAANDNKAAWAGMAQQLATSWTSIRDKLGQAINSNLLSDYSPLSPQQQFEEAKRQWQDTLAKAQSGDVTAAEALQGAGDAYLKANKEYWASANPAAFREVQAGLGSVKSVAERQIDQLKAIAGTLGSVDDNAAKLVWLGQNAGRTWSAAGWSQNAPVNMELAYKTGYMGNFGGGAFDAWIVQQSEATKAIARSVLSQMGQSDRIHFAAGGVVPHLPGSTLGQDSVSAMLMPNEGVVNLRGMALLGPGGLAALNSGRWPANDRWGSGVVEYRRPAMASSAAAFDDSRLVAGIDRLIEVNTAVLKENVDQRKELVRVRSENERLRRDLADAQMKTKRTGTLG